MPDPHRPADPESRALAAEILRGATDCALATLTEGGPALARVGCAWLPGPGLCVLLSDLSDHAAHLARDASCAVLLAPPPRKGDALTQPRLSLRGAVERIDKARHRDAFLHVRPKASLWYDFADFRLLRVAPADALLNAGFGRAHRLAPGDLPGTAP